MKAAAFVAAFFIILCFRKSTLARDLIYFAKRI